MMLGHPAVSVPGASFVPQGAAPPDTPTTSPYAATPAANYLHLYRNPFGGNLDATALALGTMTPAHSPPIISLAERCFDSYYHHGYAAHPCVLPRRFFLRLLEEGASGLEHLVAAMRYLGSIFIDCPPPARAMYLDDALRLAYLPTCPKDGYLVQTLLILILALDGSFQQEKARGLLLDCERIALEIGLNTRNFATANGRGNPVFEESWRRTWWELFVVDGMIAGVHRMTTFMLFDMPSHVALPCEEHQYLSGVSFPPPPPFPPPRVGASAPAED